MTFYFFFFFSLNITFLCFHIDYLDFSDAVSVHPDMSWLPTVFFFISFRFNKALRKHAYSYIRKILPPKNENFQIKTSDIFHISSQNTDCRYSLEPPCRGSSNEYPQSMFLSRNKKQ